jgi:GTP pyrophosphokinase
VAARRGGRLVPLSSELTDGDVVEILGKPSPSGRPSRDWLQFVRSPSAQLHIAQFFAEREPDESAESMIHKVALGRIAIQRALRRHERSLVDESPLRTVAAEMGYPDAESLAVAVVDRQVSADDVADRLVGSVDTVPRAPMARAARAARWPHPG